MTQAADHPDLDFKPGDPDYPHFFVITNPHYVPADRLPG